MIRSDEASHGYQKIEIVLQKIEIVLQKIEIVLQKIEIVLQKIEIVLSGGRYPWDASSLRIIFSKRAL